MTLGQYRMRLGSATPLPVCALFSAGEPAGQHEAAFKSRRHQLVQHPGVADLRVFLVRQSEYRAASRGTESEKRGLE